MVLIVLPLTKSVEVLVGLRPTIMEPTLKTAVQLMVAVPVPSARLPMENHHPGAVLKVPPLIFAVPTPWLPTSKSPKLMSTVPPDWVNNPVEPTLPPTVMKPEWEIHPPV